MQENGAKRQVTGTLVKVLLHRRHDRGMELEPYASRCVRQGEVHELVTTDQTQTAPSTRIDRVGFLGFAEIAPELTRTGGRRWGVAGQRGWLGNCRR